jgi:hypothetical protein
MGGDRYDVVFSNDAKRVLRELEDPDKQALVAALRDRLDQADRDVVELDVEARLLFGVEPNPPNPWLLRAAPPLHYVVYRRLTDDERLRVKADRALKDPTFIVADILPEDWRT